jgi:acyl-CoA synthetase (AMP-forming)/AMP-acid ligase II
LGRFPQPRLARHEPAGGAYLEGSCIVKGYYKKLEETVKPGKSSRFHTGDIAIVDNGQELKTTMTSRLFRACRT